MKTSTTDFALTDHFDLGNLGGVQRENTLNAFAIGDLTNGECLIEA
jgi:hypothetical protein